MRPGALLVIGLLALAGSVGCGDDDPSSEPARIEGSFCHGQPDGVLCDDGNPCTTDDVCGLGACLGRPIDDPDTCDDEDACTEGDVCSEGVCVGQSLDCEADSGLCEDLGCVPPSCDDGDPCTLDSRDGGECQNVAVDCGDSGDACRQLECGADGTCGPVAVPDGGGCDDGDPCTEVDGCVAGACEGVLKPCETGDLCQQGTCDPATGECHVGPAPDGSTCDGPPGAACTEGAQCQNGECVGGTTRPNGTPCDDADPCTSADACQAGLCMGAAMDCTSLDDLCVTGACDPGLGECAPASVEDGTPCEDGSACTLDEACSGGVCQPAEVLAECDCEGKPDETPCDDGLVCTTGDKCAGGVCLGAPKQCEDPAEPCVAATCDPEVGCVEVPRPLGTPCDDAKSCTVQDYCKDGVCIGALMDCSSLDTDCAVGECTGGACTALPRPDHTPCDDGDTCTGHDECGGGACAGVLPLCAGCAQAGDPCDDGDACTGAGTCVPVSAGGVSSLACIAEPTVDCAADAECTVAWCDFASGECEAGANTDGVSCDDGSGCTEEDTCQKGSCVGLALPLCGATPDQCETTAPNDAVTSAMAVELAATDDPFVRRFEAVGWFDTPEDMDWFELQLTPGETLSALTAPHCGEPTDTVLTILHAPGGEAQEVATDDDGAGGTFSKITGIVAAAGGTWYVGVSGHATAPLGAYELTIEATSSAPCFIDPDCGCTLKVCESNQCVPTVPEEVEPNDFEPASAGPILFGNDAVLGSFTTLTDEDWYALNLEVGQVVRIETSAWCDSPVVDPAIYLYAGLTPGLVALAEAKDTAGDGHAVIDDFKAPASGVYYVRVKDEGVATGQYLLQTSPGGCEPGGEEFGGGCECAQEVCVDGACVSSNPAPEPIGPFEPGALAVGEEVHGELETQYDVDSWEITLGPGSWALTTGPLCDEPGLDTELKVYDTAGDLVASDADSGEAWFAAIGSLELTELQTLRVDVAAHGAATGSFTLVVTPAP